MVSWGYILSALLSGEGISRQKHIHRSFGAKISALYFLSQTFTLEKNTFYLEQNIWPIQSNIASVLGMFPGNLSHDFFYVLTLHFGVMVLLYKDIFKFSRL